MFLYCLKNSTRITIYFSSTCHNIYVKLVLVCVLSFVMPFTYITKVMHSKFGRPGKAGHRPHPALTPPQPSVKDGTTPTTTTTTTATTITTTTTTTIATHTSYLPSKGNSTFT